jgi:hypothetical protein
MAISKLTSAVGRAASKKVTQAFKAGVKARKARQAASAKAAKAAERAANKAKAKKPKTKNPKTSSKKLSPAEQRAVGANRAISLARKIGGTNTITRKVSKYPKKIAKNKFVQMSALSGVSGFIGAKTAGGSSSNAVSNKSSYTQADYDEARKRIYGR